MIPAPQNPDYEAVVRSLFARQGLMEAFGVTIGEIGPGTCDLNVDYSGAKAKLQASIQGALLGALADTAAGMAVLTLVAKGNGIVTVEYKISLLEAPFGTNLVARARVRRFGRTLSLVEVDTVSMDEDGAEELCAVSTHTIMQLVRPPGDAAKPAAGPPPKPPAKAAAEPPPKKKGLFRRD